MIHTGCRHFYCRIGLFTPVGHSCPACGLNLDEGERGS